MIANEMLNVIDLMKPPPKTIGRYFTNLKDDIVTFTSLPIIGKAIAGNKEKGAIKIITDVKEANLFKLKLIHKLPKEYYSVMELTDLTTKELILSAKEKPNKFRLIMKSNDQLFLHIIKKMSIEDLKRFINDGVFTQKELVTWSKKHIPWVAERGHWVRKNYGDEIIGKFISKNGDPEYGLDNKEYGFGYFLENGRRSWIEKNYRTEFVSEMLEQYGDRVPDSVDFIVDIVNKLNEVITSR